MNRKRGERETNCHLIQSIPRPVWSHFQARLEADSRKLGRFLYMDEVLLDLIRQYNTAVTWFGKTHIR